MNPATLPPGHTVRYGDIPRIAGPGPDEILVKMVPLGAFHAPPVALPADYFGASPATERRRLMIRAELQGPLRRELARDVIREEFRRTRPAAPVLLPSDREILCARAEVLAVEKKISFESAVLEITTKG